MNEQVTRRDFLKLAWTAMATAASAGVGYVGLRFLASRVGERSAGEVIVVGVLEDFPPGTVTPFTNGQFYLVRQTDGGFLALYRKCTHLDCVVLWNKSADHFICPCHGSEFKPDGEVLNPPAPHPLARFPVAIEGSQVTVDTSALITPDQVQPGDVVYPSDPTS